MMNRTIQQDKEFINKVARLYGTQKHCEKALAEMFAPLKEEVFATGETLTIISETSQLTIAVTTELVIKDNENILAELEALDDIIKEATAKKKALLEQYGSRQAKGTMAKVTVKSKGIGELLKQFAQIEVDA